MKARRRFMWSFCKLVEDIFRAMDDLFCSLACACERKTEEWGKNAERWDDDLAEHMADQASDDYCDSKEAR